MRIVKERSISILADPIPARLTKSSVTNGLNQMGKKNEQSKSITQTLLASCRGVGFSKPARLGFLKSLIPVLFVLIFMTGCVQRRFIVRSQPEGASVTIDNQPVGRTPLSVPYTYTGTREFRLEKDGFQTIKVQQNFRPKWFESFPISLVTENFWPREIRDERVLDFQLQPKAQVQENLLLDRANDLRMNVQRGTVTGLVN